MEGYEKIWHGCIHLHSVGGCVVMLVQYGFWIYRTFGIPVDHNLVGQIPSPL